MTTPDENSNGLRTIGAQLPTVRRESSIGMLPSEIGSEKLETCAMLAQRTPRDTDARMVRDLRQCSGRLPVFSSRMMFPENGPTYAVVTGVEWECPPERLAEAARIILEGFRAAPPERIGAALYRLRTLTIGRDGTDPEAESTVWLAELVKWPGDVVLEALRVWPTRAGSGKYWPTWSELLPELREGCQRRMMLVNQLRRLELEPKLQAAIEAGDRPYAPVQVHEHPTPETPEARAATVARMWSEGLRRQIATPEPENAPAVETPAERLARLSGEPLEDVIAKLEGVPENLVSRR